MSATPTWRAATAADVAAGLEEALGAPPELAVFVDLGAGVGLVRVEVDDQARQARVAVVGGPVLGTLATAPDGLGPVTSGLWAHAPGALPVREHSPAELVAFAARHAVVEWCQPPDGVPWTAEHACYGSVFVGIEGDAVRRFEVWD